MSQIALSFDAPPVPEPVAPAPEPYDDFNQTETSMPWRALVERRWTPYEEVSQPTDNVRFASQCHCCKCTFALTMTIQELDPDAIYCLELGGAWQPRDKMLCWTCARKVVEFLTKLIV